MTTKKNTAVSLITGIALVGLIFSLMGMTATAIPKAEDGNTLPVLTTPDLSLMSILASGAEIGGPGIIEGNPGDTGHLATAPAGLNLASVITIINLGDSEIQIDRFDNNVLNTPLLTVAVGATEFLRFSLASGPISEIRYRFINGTTGKFAYVARPPSP